MNRILARFLALLLWPMACLAQFQPSLAPNMVKVCDEFCTVTQAPSNAVYQFGAGTSWSKPAVLSLPVVADCSILCLQFGGDPDAGIGKTLYVQQQATAFTLTWTDEAGTHTAQIAALTAGTVSTPQPATVTTADKTVAIKIPIPALMLTCANKNNKITCPVPGQTITQSITVPGQTANVTSVPATYSFTCSGDMQHLSCTAVKQ